MSTPVLLSIVTPTRGNFSDFWFERLLEIKGNVEFVLVYPSGVPITTFSDPRIKLVVSPFKGEVFQRMLGLLNASGEYVIALDDDDYLHPEIIDLVTKYFQRFPDSWVLRLMVNRFSYTEESELQRDWESIPDVSNLEVAKKRGTDESILREVPIAPLSKPFDLRFILGVYLKRKDMNGPHIENFNNKVWKTEMVQKTLVELSNTMIVHNALTWIPKWNLDRSLGLFVQATFYEEGKIIGHWMPSPEQVRYVITPQGLKGDFRLMLPSDALLVKRFSRYGYFWNLFFEQFWVAVRKIGRSLFDLKNPSSHANPSSKP